MTLEEGTEARKIVTVRYKDLALHWGSDFPVLATPALVGLFEATCVKASDHTLPDGDTTVGMGIDMLHLAPSPQGGEVELSARLVDVEGKKLTFHVEAYDSTQLIATGTMYRAVVAKSHFMAKVLGKVGPADDKTLDHPNQAVGGPAK